MPRKKLTFSKKATKEDIQQLVVRLSKELMVMVREYIDQTFGGLGKKLDEVHKDIRASLKDIQKSTKFLEREIVYNRIKIKELETRLEELAQPKPKLPN